MKKFYTWSVFMLLSLLGFSAQAEIDFDLTTVGGVLVMDYDAVSAERNKAQEARWISVTNFANSGTSGRCGAATKTFDIKSGRIIEFNLAKLDKLVITANIAATRGLVVSINGEANIQLDGTGVCKDYIIDVNKEESVHISVQGLNSNSAWTSFFTFYYEAKFPQIASFVVNDLAAHIDHDDKTISLELPFGNDVSNTTPVVTLGGTATSYTPAGAQNFTTGPIAYTATDGTVNTVYNANITVKSTPDTEKGIESLSVNGKAAEIYEESGVIMVEFASFAGPLASWPVVFKLNSITATADFTSGNSYDFGVNNTLSITVTAQDNSTKVYTVSPVISTKKNVAILSVNGVAEAYDTKLVSAFDEYYVTQLKAEATAPADIQAFYANYDLIVLHANVGGTNATGIASKAMVGVKPILNIKAYFYNSGRWSWSTVNPQNAPVGSFSSEVPVWFQSHPIFEGVTFTGTTLSFYDNLPVTNTNAIQYASDLATLTGMTSHTIAKFGETGIQMHEIHDNAAAKFIMVGLSMEGNNFTYFNQNTINILKNSAAYLLDPTVVYGFDPTGLNNNVVGNGIYFSQNIIHNPELVNITVYNASGAKVMTSSLNAINTGLLPQGVYIIRAEDGSSLKFIR